jgi:hypothetical protein
LHLRVSLFVIKRRQWQTIALLKIDTTASPNSTRAALHIPLFSQYPG